MLQAAYQSLKANLTIWACTLVLKELIRVENSMGLIMKLIYLIQEYSLLKTAKTELEESTLYSMLDMTI